MFVCLKSSNIEGNSRRSDGCEIFFWLIYFRRNIS